MKGLPGYIPDCNGSGNAFDADVSGKHPGDGIHGKPDRVPDLHDPDAQSVNRPRVFKDKVPDGAKARADAADRLTVYVLGAHFGDDGALNTFGVFNPHLQRFSGLCADGRNH